jgi:integrase
VHHGISAEQIASKVEIHQQPCAVTISGCASQPATVACAVMGIRVHELEAEGQSAIVTSSKSCRPPLLSPPFDHLVRDYFASADYHRLGASTQKAYRSVIERLVRNENIGHRLVRQMTRQHVQKIVGKRATTPGAANDVLKKLKILLHFAIDNGWRTDDPTVRIKRFAEGEFHTWTDDEIAQFENVWRVGTRERSVFALFLYTGQHASDVAKMSSSDIEEGGIWVVQLKTNAKLLIPMHSALTEALAVCDLSHGTILKTGFGKPFTAKGISNFMADKISAAGLPDRCVAHGLRKAAARRLAEAGCSANEIPAITGHASLEEVLA